MKRLNSELVSRPPLLILRRNIALVSALVIIAVLVFLIWNTTDTSAPTTLKTVSTVSDSTARTGLQNNLTLEQAFESLLVDADIADIKEDKTAPLAEVAGKWNMLFQHQQFTTNQMTLELDQSQGLVQGKFGDMPITALVQGNTFRFTYRIRNNGQDDLRIRHRGAVTDNNDLMKGSFTIQRNNELLDSGTWIATRQ